MASSAAIMVFAYTSWKTPTLPALTVLFADHTNGSSATPIHQFAESVARHRSSPIVEAVAQFTGIEPLLYLNDMAKEETESLYKSGKLASLTIWVPSVASVASREKELGERFRTNGNLFYWSVSTDDTFSSIPEVTVRNTRGSLDLVSSVRLMSHFGNTVSARLPIRFHSVNCGDLEALVMIGSSGCLMAQLSAWMGVRSGSMKALPKGGA